MSQAKDLLNRMADAGTYSDADKPIIVIGEDRVMDVPEELRRVAVQFDHNVKTITFSCPRYCDGLDMSEMHICVNYMLPNNLLGSDEVTNLTVFTNTMTFDWTIRADHTQLIGKLTILICIKKFDEIGIEVNHWNSEPSSEFHVSEGLKCSSAILNDYPDIVTQLLTRMEWVESVANIPSGVWLGTPETRPINCNVVINPDAETGAPVLTIYDKDGNSVRISSIAGKDGKDFTYADFTPEQLAALKGKDFTYADFTPEQIEALKVKGDPGYSPVRGKDYFTEDDVDQIVARVIEELGGTYPGGGGGDTPGEEEGDIVETIRFSEDYPNTITLTVPKLDGEYATSFLISLEDDPDTDRIYSDLSDNKIVVTGVNGGIGELDTTTRWPVLCEIGGFDMETGDYKSGENGDHDNVKCAPPFADIVLPSGWIFDSYTTHTIRWYF